MNDRKNKEGFQIFEISGFKTVNAPIDLAEKKTTVIINQKKKQQTKKPNQQVAKESDQPIQLDTQYLRNVNQGLVQFDEDFVSFRPLSPKEIRESGFQEALQHKIQAQIVKSIKNQNPFKDQQQIDRSILFKDPFDKQGDNKDNQTFREMQTQNMESLSTLNKIKNNIIQKSIIQRINKDMIEGFKNSFFSTTDKNLLTYAPSPQENLIDKLLNFELKSQSKLYQEQPTREAILINPEVSVVNLRQEAELRLIQQNSKEGLRLCQNLEKSFQKSFQVQQQSRQALNESFSHKQFQRSQLEQKFPQTYGVKGIPSLMPVVHSPPSINVYQGLSRERQTEDACYYQSRYNSAVTNKSFITEQSRISRVNFHLQLYQILFTNRDQNLKFNLFAGTYDEVVNIHIPSELFEQNEIVLVNDFTSIYMVDEDELNPDKVNNSKMFYSSLYGFLEKLDQRKTNYILISLDYEKFGLREEVNKICSLNKSIRFYYYNSYEQVPGFIHQISRNHRENIPMLEISSNKISSFQSQFDLFDMRALIKRKQQKTLYQTLVKYLQ